MLAGAQVQGQLLESPHHSGAVLPGFWTFTNRMSLQNAITACRSTCQSRRTREAQSAGAEPRVARCWRSVARTSSCWSWPAAACSTPSDRALPMCFAATPMCFAVDCSARVLSCIVHTEVVMHVLGVSEMLQSAIRFTQQHPLCFASVHSALVRETCTRWLYPVHDRKFRFGGMLETIPCESFRSPCMGIRAQDPLLACR